MFGIGNKEQEQEKEDIKEQKDQEIKEEIDKGLMVENPKDLENNEQESHPLTQKEMKAFKKANYEEISKKFNKVFVIENKRTKQIAEIRASSSYHAANMVGWKPCKCRVIEEKVVKDFTDSVKNEEPKIEDVPETVKSSSNE